MCYTSSVYTYNRVSSRVFIPRDGQPLLPTGYNNLVVGVDSQSNGCPFLYTDLPCLALCIPNNKGLHHSYVTHCVPCTHLTITNNLRYL
jgi:hypothetical protein